MITVDNMHEAILAFAKIQNIEVKKGGDRWNVRLVLPSDAINALMSNFTDTPGGGPTFALDDDDLFYAKCKSDNISLIIQEGKTYKLENIFPNQEIEKEMAGGDDILPNGVPHTDFTRPVY